MIDIMNVVIPKKIVTVDYTNADLKIVSSSYTAPDGTPSIRQKTVVKPDMKKLTIEDKSLHLDVSNNYPFKIVTLVTEDSASLIYSPSLQTYPTASQSYYAPLYAERFTPEFILAITREFTEFTVESPPESIL